MCLSLGRTATIDMFYTTFTLSYKVYQQRGEQDKKMRNRAPFSNQYVKMKVKYVSTYIFCLIYIMGLI